MWKPRIPVKVHLSVVLPVLHGLVQGMFVPLLEAVAKTRNRKDSANGIWCHPRSVKGNDVPAAAKAA